MKSIMISIKPKWCALIMNGEKTIEVRKNKALASAIRKLIDENGYADIYVYCSKDKNHKLEYCDIGNGCWCANDGGDYYNGKVVFKFWCYKVEEIRPFFHWCLENETRLTRDEVLDYLDKNKFFGNPKRQDKGYAIHISNLEIFDRPKELSKFFRFGVEEWAKKHAGTEIGYLEFWNGVEDFRLTKAPQNFCYIEEELE